MTPQEFSSVAIGTAIFPQNPIYTGAYPMLGLVGEAGELIQATKEADLEDAENVMKECGDVMWYTNALACSFDLKMDDVLGGNFSWYRQHYADFADLQSWRDFLSEQVFSLSEQIKKSIRDSNLDKGVLRDRLTAVLNSVSAVLGAYGYTLEQAAQANVDKLLSRQARDVLGGSGDNR